MSLPTHICSNGKKLTLSVLFSRSPQSNTYFGYLNGEEVAVKRVESCRLHEMLANVTPFQTNEVLKIHASNEHVVKLIDVLDDDCHRYFEMFHVLF